MAGNRNVRTGRGNIGGIKNRVGVSRVSHNLQAQLRLNTGATQDVLIRAFNGDLTALKQIGQLGIDGARISRLAPQIKTQMIAALKGAEDLNVTLSEIYKQAGISGQATQRAIQSAELENTSLSNALTEMNYDFGVSQDKEQTRHDRTMKRLNLKAFIDKHIVSEDGDYQLLKEELRLPEKQRTVDLQHDVELGQYYLAEGNRANDEFKPKKQYVKPGILEQIGNFIRGV